MSKGQNSTGKSPSQADSNDLPFGNAQRIPSLLDAKTEALLHIIAAASKGIDLTRLKAEARASIGLRSVEVDNITAWLMQRRRVVAEHSGRAVVVSAVRQAPARKAAGR